MDLPDFVEIERTARSCARADLVAAFRGWNDAGASASLAAGYLRATAEAERFAVIDSEPFVDYQQTRPHVQLEDGQVRSIEWPVTELFVAPSENLVLVLGTEPNMRWRAFTDAICTIAARTGRLAGDHAGRAAGRHARTRARCPSRRRARMRS